MLITHLKQTLKLGIYYVLNCRHLKHAEQHFKGQDVKLNPSVALLVATHNRNDLLHQVVDEFFAARGDVNLACVLVFSESAEADNFLEGSLHSESCLVLLCPNEPLGNKWQEGVQAASELAPEHLLISGSDDIIKHDFIAHALALFRDNRELCFIGVSCWTVQLKNQACYRACYEASKFGQTRVLGAGRFYSKSFLESLKWNLFHRVFESGLDVKAELKLNALSNGRKVVFSDQPHYVVSRKGGWDMKTPFSSMVSAPGISLTSMASNYDNTDVDCCGEHN